MADFGTTTGIGTGIGEALREIGAGLAERGKRRDEERDKQADRYEKMAQSIASNIAQMGGSSNPAAAPLLQQLNQTIAQHNALWPMHETGGLIDRIKRKFGRGSAPTYEQDPRGTLTSAELLAQAPVRENKLLLDRADFIQAAGLQGIDPATAGKKWWDLQTAKTGSLPRGEWAGDAYFDKERKTWLRPMVDPTNPTAGVTTVDLGPNYAPKAKSGSAQYKMNYRKDAEGNDVLTSITAADGTVYNSSNVGGEDVPENIATAWNIEQARLKDVVAQKKVDIAERQQFQIKLAGIRNDLTLQRIPYEENKSYDIVQFRSAQSDLQKSQTAFRQTQELWNQADKAQRVQNAQQDQLLVMGILGSIRAGRMGQGAMENLTTKGTLESRLEDMYRQTLGNQALGTDVRDSLIDYVRTAYNSRWDNWMADQQTVERIRSQTPGGGGSPKNVPSAQPHTRKWARDQKGGIVEQFGPNDWRYVRWDGKQWADTGQKYTAPAK